MTLLDFFQRLEDSPFSQALLESQYAYPVIESVHVLSLALSVGLLAVADLRLAGAYMRREPVAESLEQLRPWMLAGFVLMFASGIVLFVAEAAKVWVKPMFQIKMVFLALAAANAVYFELTLGRRVHDWGGKPRLPAGATIAGALSLVCWAVVILCGRWVAYGL